eukprot:187294_1
MNPKRMRRHVYCSISRDLKPNLRSDTPRMVNSVSLQFDTVLYVDVPSLCWISVSLWTRTPLFFFLPPNVDINDSPFHSNAPKSGYKSPSQSHELSITSFVCTTSSSSSSISSLSDVFFLFTFCSFAPFMDKYKLHV